MGIGLPRTRGDRPPNAVAVVVADRAPPHARGSTLALSATVGGVTGSPARAGIDPRRHQRGEVAIGLPRTRGDRPARGLLNNSKPQAPPHARGSTFERQFSQGTSGGSPARAGIDPKTAAKETTAPRLPRTRGDRPLKASAIGASLMAPPHARGSTLPRDLLGGEDRGSPARAGIDPGGAGSTGGTSGLPRTRGDRPSMTKAELREYMAPPHARGSTRGSDLSKLGHSGSPARAGIDPLLRDG